MGPSIYSAALLGIHFNSCKYIYEPDFNMNKYSTPNGKTLYYNDQNTFGELLKLLIWSHQST